jgi:hypothetical protein
MLKHFAFIADSEVFSVSTFEDNNPTFFKWIAVFSSNPEIVNLQNYPDVNKTYFYNDGNFYAPEDLEMASPINTGESLPEGVSRFAIIADNDVVGVLTYIKEDMDPNEFDRMTAGLSSNPTVVECDAPTYTGWTWNGESFVSPVG